MRANLDLTHGALFSQRALLALVESGRSRDEAYRIVQENARHAWETGTPFRDLLGVGGARARPRRGVRPGGVRSPRQDDRRAPGSDLGLGQAALVGHGPPRAAGLALPGWRCCWASSACWASASRCRPRAWPWRSSTRRSWGSAAPWWRPRSAALLLMVLRQPRPRREQLGRLALVGVGVVVGFPLFTALALRDLTSAHGAVIVGLLPGRYGGDGRAARGRAPVARLLAGLRRGPRRGARLRRHPGRRRRRARGRLRVLRGGARARSATRRAGRSSRELGGWQTICWALLLSMPVVAPFAVAAARHRRPLRGHRRVAGLRLRVAGEHVPRASSRGTRGWPGAAWRRSDRCSSPSRCSPWGGRRRCWARRWGRHHRRGAGGARERGGHPAHARVYAVISRAVPNSTRKWARLVHRDHHQRHLGRPRALDHGDVAREQPPVVLKEVREEDRAHACDGGPRAQLVRDPYERGDERHRVGGQVREERPAGLAGPRPARRACARPASRSGAGSRRSGATGEAR